jgi:hypothetical protein
MREKRIKRMLVFIVIVLTFNIISVSGASDENVSKRHFPVTLAEEDDRGSKNSGNSGTTSSSNAQDKSQENKKQQPVRKPSKKFVPSEKIEVDTVVDFPIDI